MPLMFNIKQDTIETLERLHTFILKSPWRDQYAHQISEIQKNLDEPCVLAIAGRVKTGKSSFINAFLKEDLALVGITETTATINYFRYGQTPDPQKPVKCVWHNNMITWESIDFLNSLQGYSLEVLKRANGIRRLEFFVTNPLLEHVRLVDTPGIGAITEDDTHQARTAEFFQIRDSLRDRHNNETISLATNADALIYLTDHVIQECDKTFITEFQDNLRKGATKSTAINILGIMGMSDKNEKLLDTPERAADYVRHEKDQLNNQLEMPIPVIAVSSGIQRALDRLGIDGLANVQNTLRKYYSKEDMDLALGSDTIFFNRELTPDFHVEQRRQMVAGIPWMAFRIIAKTLYDNDPLEKAIKILERYSGFSEVRDVLDRHFFQRGELLRCITVISKVMNLLYQLMNDELAKYHQRFQGQLSDIDDFARFILSHPDFTPKENSVGRKLQKFISSHIPVDSFPDLSQQLNIIHKDFAEINANLFSVKESYEGLQLIESNLDCVDDKEKVELYELFGLYPTSQEANKNSHSYCIARSLYWRRKKEDANSSIRKIIAEIAERQYQRLNNILTQKEGN